MKVYLLKRLLLIPVTLFLIITLNFFIVQVAPGGPVERAISALTQTGTDALGNLGGGAGDIVQVSNKVGKSAYQGASGLDENIIKDIQKQYGFDQPILVRYFKMLKNYAMFDLGESYFKGDRVSRLILDKMPVSLSLGLWSTLLIYLISIPLGVHKAKTAGSLSDTFSSFMLVIGYAIPAFLFAVILIILFAGASYLQWFPLRGLYSDDFASFSIFQKIVDYFWHLALPVTAMTIGGFAAMTFLTKNAFLEELGKQYVLTARAKGLSEHQVLYGHVFRNAMLLVISSIPATLLGLFFTGSLIIEIIFSLDGLGLLGYEAVLNRDYPVMFGTLYIFTLVGLIGHFLSDVTYHLIDPRINFDAQG